MKHLPTHQPNRSRFALVFLLFMTFLLGSVQGWGQSFRSASTSTSTSTSVTINKPANLAVGDLMIAQISQSGNDGLTYGNATSTNWILISGREYLQTNSNADRYHVTLLYKFATSADIAATGFIFNGNNNPDDVMGGIMAFSNACQVSVVGSWGNTTNDNSYSAPSITTLTANSIVVMFGAVANDGRLATDNTWSFNGTSMAERYDVDFNAAKDMGIAAATVSLTSVTSGSGTATISGNENNSSILLAISPSTTAGTLSGTQAICSNGTTTFSSSAFGGTWTSGSTGVATINSSTGIVTPVSAGSATMTYTVSGTGSCSNVSATRIVTITALPSATISYVGTPFCKSLSSSQTVTRTGTAGGIYSSSAGLTIDSNTGAITPSTSTPGTYTVIYTMAGGGGCSAQTATTSVSINAQPTASAGGVQTICQGNTATVSGASSSNGTIAWTENGSGSITSGANTLTPVYTSSSSDISQVTLTMTVSSVGCANATATYTVYVTANPTAGTLSGTQAICANTTTTFAVSGSSGGTGVFSTSNSAIATVNASTGVVSGISAGSATITYTVTGSSGCVATATRTVTVAPAPSALTISPASATICNGDIQSLEVSGGIGGTPNAVLTSTAASGSVNLAIPDNSSTGVSNTLAISSIPLNGTITKIDVTLNLTHAWLNDVEITLTAPNGKVIALAADQGPGAQGSYSNTVITSDNAAPVLSTTVTPITGTFRANATASGTLIGGTFGGNLTQIFSDLFSIQNGSWKITAFDDAAQDLGTLDSWSIAITYSTPQIIWSPTTGLYTNAPATTSYTGSPSATVYAKPTETITYTATATSSAGCTSSNTVEVIVNNPTNYYADADGDTFGNPAVSTSACAQPTGYVTDNTDCNDNNASIKPAPFGLEVCNSIDDDCDGLVDDGLGTNSYFQDSDNDTFGNPSVSVVSCAQPSGYVLNNSDCNDNNATISYNVYYADADGDSFGDQESTTQGCSTQTGYVSNYSDCDDTKSAVNPNATEICNEFDDDCDGLVNEGVALSDYHQDSDGDGYGSGTAVALCQPTAGYVQNSLDCDDTNASANPNGQEICGNDIDEDCSGVDLYPSFYVSVAADGSWRQAATWNYSCDNSNFLAANYAPPADYTGDVLIAANTTVTVTKFPTASQTGILRIAANGNLVLAGNQATNAPTAANVGEIAKLTVLNGIVNNGTLTIGHHASLLQTGATANSGNGNFVVNVEFTGNNNGAATPAPNGRYWYLGSPMNNTNAGSTFLDPSNMVRLWGYNGSLNSWEVIVHSGTGATTSNTLIPGIGYLYRAGNNETVTYTGNAAAFNNNITSNLLQPTVTSSMVPLTGYQSSTGYKFVANPYMSHIDWKLVTRTGLNVSYWIRNASNTAYESYNATSGVSNSPSGQTIKDIPPMQGFWVYAFNTSPSLVINNGDRVHSSNVVHAPIHNQIVRLNLNDGKTDDQAVVYENDNANNGIEEFDTDKFMDENYHQVYFLEGSKQLSLDGLKDATAKQKVDMGIQITSAGTYTINAVELGVEEDVVLEDKFTHTFQDLKRNSSYSFTSNAGTFNNRFVLHFTLNPQTETSMESVAVTEEVTEVEGVSVYTTTGQQVKVWVTNTTDFQNATVKVYDSVGNMIERKNMTSNELLLDLNTATGVYLVEVTGDSKVFTKKIFITK